MMITVIPRHSATALSIRSQGTYPATLVSFFAPLSVGRSDLTRSSDSERERNSVAGSSDEDSNDLKMDSDSTPRSLEIGISPRSSEDLQPITARTDLSFSSVKAGVSSPLVVALPLHLSLTPGGLLRPHPCYPTWDSGRRKGKVGAA